MKGLGSTYYSKILKYFTLACTVLGGKKKLVKATELV